jgi:plasmid stabilization system protein ParE
MKVRYTRRADSDLHQILDYLGPRSPKGAANVLTRIGDALQKLSEQPSIGHATDVSGVRVLFIGRYPHKIFYRLSGSQLEILHIRHTARRPGEIE